MLLWQLFVNGVLVGGVYALVAVGFGLIYRTTHFFNFAHGAVYALGAYVAYFFHQVVGLPPAISIVLGIIGGASIGAAMWILLYRPLRRAGASDLIQLLASVGIFTICQNFISATFGDATTSLRFVGSSRTLEVLGARITVLQVVIATVAFALCLGVTVILWRTRVGNTILAVGADADLAECSGIDSNAVILGVFAVGSGMAALAGILVGMDTDITPLMGYAAMLNAVVAVMIGGARNPLGWLAGSIVLGVAQRVGVWGIKSHWQDWIAFTLLLLFMVFRPRGIVPPIEAR